MSHGSREKLLPRGVFTDCEAGKSEEGEEKERDRIQGGGL